MPPVSATSVWSRRGFLATATASALGLTARPARATPGPATAAADEFTTLRGRWCELTLGSGFDPAAPPYAAALQETGALASTFQASMRPAAGSLWPDCRYDPPSGITQSYSRLATMAQAYVQPGTGRTGDPGLAADLVTGPATSTTPSTTPPPPATATGGSGRSAAPDSSSTPSPSSTSTCPTGSR